MVAEDALLHSQKLEKLRLGKVRTYKDVYKFIGIKNIRYEGKLIVGYSKKDNANLLFEVSKIGSPIICKCYTIDKKPAYEIERADDEPAYVFYYRCLKEYGNEVKRW